MCPCRILDIFYHIYILFIIFIVNYAVFIVDLLLVFFIRWHAMITNILMLIKKRGVGLLIIKYNSLLLVLIGKNPYQPECHLFRSTRTLMPHHAIPILVFQAKFDIFFFVLAGEFS
ncbi:hypothetical protein ACJX0J_018903 [Zea mays]